VGPAGWQYPDWKGIVYPTAGREFDALVFVASYFNVIEINSTFYRTPAQRTVRRWAERIAHIDGFRFTLKALNRFTHSRDGVASNEVEAFRRAIDPLHEAGRLSCVLLQFPWSFRDAAAARRRIETLAGAFAPVPVAVEVRHGTWARNDAWRFLESTGLTVCGIDQPVIGDSLKPGRFLTGSAGTYFRLHGRNYRNWFSGEGGRDARYDYLYTHEQLAPWVRAIAGAAESGAPVNVVLNNHFRGQAPANAFEIMAELTGERVPAPRSMLRAFPRLADVADATGDAEVAEGWLFDSLATEENEQEEDHDTGDAGDPDVRR
jgi:uncharacterized protein YecE (DUF72 family)